MKEILLSQGKVAKVDDGDYAWLSRWKWYANKQKNGDFYAVRHSNNGSKKLIMMHRQILGVLDNLRVHTDHKNHNGLDNRRKNLRLCTNSQNQANRKLQKGTSRYKGVCWSKSNKKWVSQVCFNGQTFNLGGFDNEADAARAYNEKAAELFGEFAALNNVKEQEICQPII